MRPQQFLYFLPLPQGQGSLRPTFGISRRTGASSNFTSPSPSASPLPLIALPIRSGRRPGQRAVGGRSGRALLPHEKLREGGEKRLEGLQVRGAAKEIVQHFILNVRHQIDKHLVGFRLVFDQRILLRVAAEVDAFAERVHRVKMLLPEAIDRVQDDVALEALNRGRFFVARLALVSFLDFPDQEFRILLGRAGLELRLLFR